MTANFDNVRTPAEVPDFLRRMARDCDEANLKHFDPLWGAVAARLFGFADALALDLERVIKHRNVETGSAPSQKGTECLK